MTETGARSGEWVGELGGENEDRRHQTQAETQTELQKHKGGRMREKMFFQAKKMIVCLPACEVCWTSLDSSTGHKSGMYAKAHDLSPLQGSEARQRDAGLRGPHQDR